MSTIDAGPATNNAVIVVPQPATNQGIEVHVGGISGVNPLPPGAYVNIDAGIALTGVTGNSVSPINVSSALFGRVVNPA